MRLGASPDKHNVFREGLIEFVMINTEKVGTTSSMDFG
jgi:hypothetical protein